MSISNSQIHYQLSVSSIAGHLFAVTLDIEKPAPKGQRLSLPAWIPGSYKIRDFAKNIVTIAAKDQNGNALSLTKVDKQNWLVEKSSGPISVEYQVYAYDLSVRGAYINDEMAFLNGTNLFLAVEGQTQHQCKLTINQPTHPNCTAWQVATTMPTTMTKHHEFGEYWAADYAELVDHPVLIGEFDCITFGASGVEFELILAGGHQSDVERIKADLTAVCQHHIDFFNDTAPINRYQFITLLTDNAFGGLEHISSTALMYSRNDLPDKSHANEMTDGYRVFLSLCSHEFFHTWHVKRIKPVELFDAPLSHEQYTEQLWIYEGFTSYYDDFSLLKSGLITEQEYLKVVAQNLTRLHRNTGRFKQTLTQSSFDAWTKFYQQDESAINNIVSYYNKGAVVAMCLDLLIRDQSQGKFSLQDVMQQLWQQYGMVNTPTPTDVIQRILEQQLALDLSDFLHLALYTTKELPVDRLLTQFGIKVNYSSLENLSDKGGKPSDNPIKVDFGAQIKSQEIGVKVTQVSQESAAYKAGVMVGDIIIALGQWQVSEARLKALLNNLVIGKQTDLVLLRDKKLKTLKFTAAQANSDTLSLSIQEPSLSAKWLGSIN